jgi:glycosyltransferase involved in cell wall biosynthesis
MQQSSNKIKVIHFQRKPRPGFNFSIENIFEGLRRRLSNKIDFTVKTSSSFNDGYLSKFSNIVEAAFRQKKKAIAHITGEVNFLGLLMRKKNILLTIHDCGYMERKTGLAKKMVGWLYLNAPVKKAAFITVVSANTKKEVIRYTGCDADKIKVIPVTVSEIYKPVYKAFNKACPVILQVGAASNKNLSRLIEAIKDIQCSLVIIGGPGNDELEKLQRYKITHTIKSNLSPEALYEEYINCDMLAFVSTYEGFGMPIVEANCVERAVLTSNISSMPEVAGDAACFADPYNIEGIRNGVIKIIQDDAYREQLIINGRKNRLRFIGETIADLYYTLYQKIASCL